MVIDLQDDEIKRIKEEVLTSNENHYIINEKITSEIQEIMKQFSKKEQESKKVEEIKIKTKKAIKTTRK